MICPGLVADDLSGFWRVSKPGDRDATRGADGEVYRGTGAISSGAVELWGGGGTTGDKRATLPAASRPLRGGRGGGTDRSASWPSLGTASADGPDRVCRRTIPDALLGLYGKAFPRGIAGRAWVSPGLHLDQGDIAEPRLGAGGAQALGASQEETASAVAGNDVVPGWLNTRVAGGSAGARSDCHPGRRDQRDLLGLSGRGGRDGFELHGVARGDRGPGAVLLALYRSRQPLLPDTPGRRQSRPGASDPGRACLGGAEDRAHSLLQPGGTRPHGTSIRHLAAAAACCGCTTSPRSRRPTGISGRSTSPSITAALRGPRPKRAAPSCRSSARCTISCAFATSAWSATITACATKGGYCRSPSSAIAGTLSK